MPAVWFANPVMLGGLGLAALPILIHLLYRRRPVAMDWGAMRYLRLAAERQTRRMRLEQWLLLMLRCLIIAFAVLATAQPYWEAPAAGGAVRRPQFHVLVVDCSLSVRAVAADGRSVFAHVRDAAVETLDRGGEADRWCLVRLDARRPLVLVDAAVASAALVRRTLEELKPGYGTADVLAALRETVQLLRQAPKGFDRRVTVISDFQRTGWAPSSEEERRRLASLLADLERHAGVALRPVSAATAENLAIVDWYARRPLLFSGRTAEVAVRLANHSGRPRKAVPVRLRVGEQWQPAASVDVPAEGTADAVFRFRVSDPGPLPLRAEVPEDVLPADNVAFAVLRVQETARVLIVDGRFGEPPQRRSAFFVRQALEPLGEAEPVSPYRVTVIADSQLPLTDLASFDAVVVCDVPLWTETEVERLRRYVLSGGALITSLGSDTDAGNANRHLSAGDPPLLGGRILQRRALVRGPSDDSGGAPPAGKKPTGAADPTAFLIGPVLWDHPVFDPLRGNDRSGLTTVVVLAYWKVRPEEQSEVLIRLLNDDPLLIVRRAGRGRIATLTCGLDPASTTWPVWGSSFV
ncbi:MAG: VWA domain-containing protein, partial [Planctomycetota bacterium]